MKHNQVDKRIIAKAHKTYLQAQQFQQTGHLGKSESLYKQILSDIPGQKDSLHYLGLIYLQKGLYEKAQTCIKKSLRDNPNPLYYSNYGLYFQQLFDYDNAIIQYKKALALKQDYPEAWFNLGLIYFALGENIQAESSFNNGLKYRPDYIKALFYLSCVQEILGKIQESRRTSEIIFELKPDNSKDYMELATCIREYGGHENYKKAAEYYRIRLDEYPHDINCALSLGTLYEDVNRIGEALKVYENCMQLEPEHYNVNIKYVSALISNNNYLKAEKLLDRLYSANQQDILLNNLKGKIEAIKGNFDNAQKYYLKTLGFDKNNISALCGLTNIAPGKNNKNIINNLIKISEHKKDIIVEFTLGKLFDEQHDYENAFLHYKKANQLKFKKVGFNKELHKKYTGSILELQSYLEKERQTGINSDEPIFIVGTPRSGTTLVEQIVSSHHGVFGGGERDDINALYNRFIENRELKLDYLANTYLNDIRKLAIKKYEKYTDKMPGNFMLIGFIKHLFPEAAILHCRRHPADSCLSMFFQNFTRSNEYSFDLDSLVFWYHEYNRMMEVWNEKYGDSIYPVYYDLIIDNTELSARDILKHCGLDWDKNVLEYYKSRREINTASIWQVRQPVYNTSRERWKKYEKYIPELITGLSDLSDKYHQDLDAFKKNLEM